MSASPFSSSGGVSSGPFHRNANVGLNAHAHSFQVGSNQMVGLNNAALLNAPRPPARRYDSEPLHGSGTRDRFTATIHSASYLTTSSSSQVSSRTTSRTSSVATSANQSHMASPRSISPHGQHLYYQSQQQQQSSPPAGTAARSLLHTPNLMVTPPSMVSSAPLTHTHRPTAVSGTTSPSGDSRPTCCATCADTRQENIHLRAQIAAFNYQLEGVKNSTKAEIQKMRQDVTKALVAFESRLHLQLQQQMGFQPELEPMAAAHPTALPQQPTTNVVSQALTQIQKQLDQFESRTLPPSDATRSGQNASSGAGSPYLLGPSSKRASWNPAGSPIGSSSQLNSTASPATSQQAWTEGATSANGTPSINSPYTASSPAQSSSGLLSHSHLSLPSHSQPQSQPATPNSILANLNLSNLNLGNVNLQQLSQLLNAVSNLQQLAGQSQMAGNGLLQPPSPHPQHHHQQPAGMTEERLIMLAIDILSVHGAVPVGKMGSLLHKAANDHTLPQMLKERYGGLKKFLQAQTQFFSLGTDHPYNPSLSLSPEFLAANPHIRPPEPQAANQQTLEAALPPALGSTDPATYQQYTTQSAGIATGLGHASNTSSLLTAIGSTHSASSPNLQLQYEYTPRHLDSFDTGRESIDELHHSDFHYFGADDRIDSLFRPSRSDSSLSLSGHVTSTSASSGTTSRTSIAAPDAGTGAAWPTTLPADAKLSPKDPAIPDDTTTPTRDSEDLPLQLHVENSPTLGATEASADANRTFFSRLLS